jgi:hypothetical protein
MLADVLPTPTLALDYLYLGPLGIAVGVVILAAAILVGRALRRRGKGWGMAIAGGIAVFVALDLVVYFLYLNVLRGPYDRPLPPVVDGAGPPGQAR